MSQFLYFYFYCYILAQVLYIFVLTTIVALFISCVLYLLFLISYSKIGEKFWFHQTISMLHLLV